MLADRQRADESLIRLGRAASRLTADEREMRRLALKNPHCADPLTGFPVPALAREVALRLLDWQPEPLADLR